MLLETERLYLRQFQMSDAMRMHEYRDKPEVKKYQSWRKYTLKDAIKRIAALQAVEDFFVPHTNYHFAIILKDNDLLIGDLFTEVTSPKTFILGYTLDSPYWSKGYATEIVTAFLRYMKETYHFEKVICYAYKDNLRSIHLLEKLNFHRFNDSLFYRDVGYVKRL